MHKTKSFEEYKPILRIPIKITITIRLGCDGFPKLNRFFFFICIALHFEFPRERKIVGSFKINKNSRKHHLQKPSPNIRTKEKCA